MRFPSIMRETRGGRVDGAGGGGGTIILSPRPIESSTPFGALELPVPPGTPRPATSVGGGILDSSRRSISLGTERGAIILPSDDTLLLVWCAFRTGPGPGGAGGGAGATSAAIN